MTEEDIEEARKKVVPAKPEPLPATFTVEERLGIGVYNPRGLTNIVITSEGE
jgi:hypothetical protein